MKIGILSDTHGLLRPEVLDSLEGCDAILHGGDINRQSILDRLGQIAPVYAVRGNNDKEWAAQLPEFLDVSLAGMRVYMTHRKKDLPEDLTGYDLAVYGHSHQYEERRQGHTLLLNPGSCGPRRFHLPITMAVAEIEDGRIMVTRVDIPHEAGSTTATDGVDIKRQIEIVMQETDKGRSPAEIEQKHGISAALAEQIARLYVTHPGVTADGIMTKMGL
ncbi:MAG: metallophosphoesterase family protein [Christensenellaceae bacterium]|nr:metallophosphoesterase family protein [Christensenellaceae bacterium]